VNIAGVRNKFIDKKTLFFVFVSYLILGLITYKNLVFFGLASDEYRGLYIVRNAFIVPHLKSFKVFLSPYFGQYGLLSILNYVFAFNPAPFYLTGIILRIISSLSIYILCKKIFKNHIICVIAGLYSLLAFAGVQSLWPINSSVYLSIILMNIGLVKWIDHLEDNNFTSGGSTSVIFFLIAFAVNTIRMHGLIPLVIAIEVLAVIVKKSKISHSSKRIFIFIAGLYILKRFGFLESSYGSVYRVSDTLLNPNYYTKLDNPIGTLLFPLTTYSRLLIPQELNNIIISFLQSLSNNMIVFSIFLFFPGFILFVISQKRLKMLAYLPISIYLILLILTDLYIPANLLTAKYQLFFSSFIVALFTSNLLHSVKSKAKMQLLTKSLIFIWPLLFMLVPYLTWPFLEQGNESRYFSVSLVGMSLTIAYLFSIIPRKRYIIKSLFILFLVITILSNIRQSQSYINYGGESGTYQKYIESSFNTMNSEIGNRKNKNRPVVYLKGDRTEFAYLAIVEGGKERFSLLNDNLSENAQPYFVYSIDEMKDIYLGKSFLKIPDINDYFAFEIKNKKVYSISDDVRKVILN